MVLKIKSIPSFKRRDNLESKYIIKNKFLPFQNTKKGRFIENLAKMTLNDLYMTSEVKVDL